MITSAFIISTGRTATQSLAAFFNNPEANQFAYHEPKPNRHLRFLSNLYIDHRISEPLVKRLYRLSRFHLIPKNGTYIESNPYLFGLAPVLRQVFNKPPIIIHVIRHPISYAISHLNHGAFTGSKLFFMNYVPYWFINLEDYGNPTDPLLVMMARWDKINPIIEEQNVGYEHYYRVKYEDLFSNDPKDRIMITKLLGIKDNYTDIPTLNDSQLKVAPEWHSLSSENKNNALKLVKEKCVDYGYEIE